MTTRNTMNTSANANTCAGASCAAMNYSVIVIMMGIALAVSIFVVSISIILSLISLIVLISLIRCKTEYFKKQMCYCKNILPAPAA